MLSSKEGTTARRDLLLLAVVGSAIWLLIERTDICSEVFAYVAQNPDLELDSLILAGIISSVGAAIFAVRRWEDARTAAKQAGHLAHHDALTGWPNRRALSRELERLCESDLKAPFACILLDLNRFKTVNDRHGHNMGDWLLQQLAARLTLELRTNIFPARIGGDEFAFLCPTDGYGSEEFVAENISRLVGREFTAGALTLNVGASIGIACFPRDADCSADLLRRADIALYRAKAAGLSKIERFSQFMEDAVNTRGKLAEAMGRALDNGEFQPHYQPLIDLSTGEIAGCEILARWNSPEFGNVPPTDFIPLATDTGLIGKLTSRLLEQACVEAKTWPTPIRISMNVAPQQLIEPRFAIQMLATLAKTGFPPSRLDIEVTENALLDNIEEAQKSISSLKKLGVTISLDDFGTGYSSLHHLRSLPFDKIKIDRSYVSSLTECEEARRMVDAIVGIGKALRIPVLAEGVETPEQEAILRQHGCEFGQGWLYGRPCPSGNIVTLLSKRQTGAQPSYGILG